MDGLALHLPVAGARLSEESREGELSVGGVDCIMVNVGGATRVFGILADPIAQVKTPEAMNALFAVRGLDAVLVPIHVGASDLETVLAGLRHMRNFGGFIATVPHKTAMLPLCDALEGDAAKIGAVNAVRRERDGRLVGAMLDGTGFVEGLRASGIDPRGLDAYVAGAGGAAAAIAFALVRAGVSRLTVANRSRDRADDLQRRLMRIYPALPVSTEEESLASADLVVNATSLGMQEGDPLPLDVSRLRPSQTVAEIIMQPAETPLVVAAREIGCRVQLGRPMLDAQIVLMARHMGALNG